VEKEVGRKAKHVESTPVIETFRGVIVWNGVVETFGIARHPQVKLCYAFIYIEDNGKARRVVVKATAEVNSPRRAFGRFFVSQVEGRY
jgi:hypothetical protein